MVTKASWKIDGKKTAFLTIDLQAAFLEPDAPAGCAGARDFLPKVNELARMCRNLGIPVIHVRTLTRPDLSDVGLMHEIRPRTDSEWEYIKGRKGAEFDNGLDFKEGDYEVVKIRYSCFIPGSSNLEPLLRGLGRDSFIICGVATDVCVGTTTVDAMMLGFRVFYIGDLTTTFNQERQKAALQVFDMHFAKVMTFKQVKEELVQL